MDRYTKTVLTIIAISLTFIAVKIWEPKEAHTGVLSGGPVLGDLMDLREIKDPTKLHEAQARLFRSLPLVRIQGGSVEVSGGRVEIDH